MKSVFDYFDNAQKEGNETNKETEIILQCHRFL